MYLVTLNGIRHRAFSSNEYVEAMEYAAQLDFEYNSSELNNGVCGKNVIKLVGCGIREKIWQVVGKE